MPAYKSTPGKKSMVGSKKVSKKGIPNPPTNKAGFGKLANKLKNKKVTASRRISRRVPRGLRRPISTGRRVSKRSVRGR